MTARTQYSLEAVVIVGALIAFALGFDYMILIAAILMVVGSRLLFAGERRSR